MILSKTALVLALGGAATVVVAQLHCVKPFDDNPACTSPADIDTFGDCPKLPDCPSWCDPDDATYCPGTTVIPGDEILKYETEFFAPPVLVDRTFDRKTVAVREFLQPILPESQYPKTRVWGYGDPDFWNGPDDPISFHNPAPSMEVWKDSPIKLAFLNDLVEDPEACRCNGNPEDCKALKHILQDCAGHPVVDTLLHWANPGGPVQDKAVCHAHDAEGESAAHTDCTGNYSYVYDGPIPNVAHVHGAHADPESDGFTEAWFLPMMNETFQTLYTSDGDFTDTFGPTFVPVDVCPGGGDDGLEANTYRNDQPTSTLFFHDHSLGMTRLNVFATSAGFYFIRDGSCVSKKGNGTKWYGESGMDCGTNTLPGPPPTAELFNNKNWYVKPPYADETVRELPIAIQDMSFYLEDEKNETRQFYPADHDNFLDEDGVLVPDRWGCNNLKGNAAYQNHEDAHENPKPVAPIWNPEVFFDVAVVNGRAWPEHQVRPNLYRLRLLDACDSRTLSLSAWAVPFGSEVSTFDQLFDGDELPIWVIGTEQSLLPSGPAKILSTTDSVANTLGSVEKFNCGASEYSQEISPHQGLLMQPGERYDALIDFAGHEGKQVYLVNTGPEEPFKTFELVDQSEGSNRAPFDALGQIMRFNVSLEEDPDDISTPPEELCFGENPGGVPKFTDVVPKKRDVYLKEEVTATPDLGPFAAVLDNVFGDPEEGKGWAKPITENVKLGAVEEWSVINLSADSHPVHLHQVKFELVSRCKNDADSCEEGTGVLGYETGWKDAVISYPNVDEFGDPVLEPPETGSPVGFTTKIRQQLIASRMKFDILGVYVWHCHILSYEDNEMMRPLCVYDADDLTTLNNCCPKGLVYDQDLWTPDGEGELACIAPLAPCDGKNRKRCFKADECAWDDASEVCVEGDRCSDIPKKKKCKRSGCSWNADEGKCEDISTSALRGKIEDAKDPMQMKSSSHRTGLKASAMLAGLVAMLWA